MAELSSDDMRNLVTWYRIHKRSFPWRDRQDPYDVWLSEIMLQQTRTEAVISYFQRFKKEICDIRTLSTVDDDRLLRLWEGLGYYSRARNLKKTAIILMKEYDGKIPCDYDALLKLPGIGPYTAGAIMSIGFGKPYPAIDGNVLRVLSRYFAIREDIRKESVRKDMEGMIRSFYLDNEIYDEAFIKDLSQAFMDLGAMVCIPNGKPLCEKCPLGKSCLAFKEDIAEELPYRSGNKKRKIVQRTLLIIRNKDRFLLAKRPEKGLLAGMYEFIGVDEKYDVQKALSYLKERDFDVLRLKRLPGATHVFTHIEWQMTAYEIIIGNRDLSLKENEVLADRKQLETMALPGAFKTYIEYYSLRGEE